MLRLLVVCITAAVVGLSLLFHGQIVGEVAGLLAGAWFFMRALILGGGLIDARINRPAEERRDPNAAISMGLAAAGLACTAVVERHYPFGFRIFFGVCLCAGLIVSLVSAYRYRNVCDIAAADRAEAE